jgi:protein-disulfide isomerase
MAEDKTNPMRTPLLLLVAVVIGAGLGYGLTMCCKSPCGAPPPMPAAPDVDKLADAIAVKVADAVAVKVAEKLAGTAPVAVADGKTPATPIEEKKPEAAAAPAEEKKPEAPAAPVEERKPETPAAPVEVAPTPPPVPAGSAEEGTGPKDTAWLARSSRYATKLGANPAVGNDKALVQVFIISDFQCPVCKRAADGVEELIPQFTDEEVQWIFWQNPLDMHQKALPIAVASMAALQQGKFWEFHNLMFANQRDAEPEDIASYAEKVGVDLPKFRTDQQAAETLAKVRSDQAASEKVGARGTPSFLINGKLQVGWGSAAGIGSMIRTELDQVKLLVSGGMSVEEARKKRASLNAENPEQAQVYVTHFLDGEPATR